MGQAFEGRILVQTIKTVRALTQSIATISAVLKYASQGGRVIVLLSAIIIWLYLCTFLCKRAGGVRILYQRFLIADRFSISSSKTPLQLLQPYLTNLYPTKQRR